MREEACHDELAVRESPCHRVHEAVSAVPPRGSPSPAAWAEVRGVLSRAGDCFLLRDGARHYRLVSAAQATRGIGPARVALLRHLLSAVSNKSILGGVSKLEVSSVALTCLEGWGG